MCQNMIVLSCVLDSRCITIWHLAPIPVLTMDRKCVDYTNWRMARDASYTYHNILPSFFLLLLWHAYYYYTYIVWFIMEWIIIAYRYYAARAVYMAYFLMLLVIANEMFESPAFTKTFNHVISMWPNRESIRVVAACCCGTILHASINVPWR